jgi:hypothetical protein
MSVPTHHQTPGIKTTNAQANATIKTVLGFAMSIPASANHEEKYVQEIYPNIAAVDIMHSNTCE